MGYAGELASLGADQLRSRVIGALLLPDVPATREVSPKKIRCAAMPRMVGVLENQRS